MLLFEEFQRDSEPLSLKFLIYIQVFHNHKNDANIHKEILNATDISMFKLYMLTVNYLIGVDYEDNRGRRAKKK